MSGHVILRIRQELGTALGVGVRLVRHLAMILGLLMLIPPLAAAALLPAAPVPPVPVPWNAAVQGAFVTCLAADHEGQIWVGTEDQGVWRYDATAAVDRACTHFTSRDGLGDDNAYAIAVDSLHRYSVTVTLDQQSKKSEDTYTDCTRIAVRDTSYTSTLSTMADVFIHYSTIFCKEPYEWGGTWFGGLDSAGQYVGGGSESDPHAGDGYGGYRMDCSGLVCTCADKAGYNWPVRTNTDGLMGSDYTEAVSNTDFQAGDIVDWPKHHVVICIKRDATHLDTLTINNAHGKDVGKVQEESASLSTLEGQGYYCRRLVKD
ncbi:MAG TPA: hypothetical protein VFJ58_20285 [Armatimonadota bacterium]|nr:hypothetical protein [Armatimonadota bacterium]